MGNRHVIFIHGIGPQKSGYSDSLWKLMAECGDLSSVTRHEMLYSDVFQDMNNKIAPLSDPAALAGSVNDLLGKCGLPTDTVGNTVASIVRDTIMHVVYFLFFTDPRNEILLRFQQQMLEVLNLFEDPAAAEITIISHSLGTVVAYAGLQQIVGMQGLGVAAKVRVKDLYTLASPLQMIDYIAAISAVRALHLDLPAFACQPIAKPSVQYDNSDPESNVDRWWSYRQDIDPVASAIPLEGSFLDAPPFVFSGGAVHAFDNYMLQARAKVVAGILGQP